MTSVPVMEFIAEQEYVPESVALTDCRTREPDCNCGIVDGICMLFLFLNAERKSISLIQIAKTQNSNLTHL